MIDFKKRLGSKAIGKKVNPVEIYDQLDRRSQTGPLRPIQQEILKEWWSHRKDEQDLILKLHTGQGKTLIGLLILQSRLNERKSPCLYVCPNVYLVQQTCLEADKFGIGYVTIGKDNSLPEEFLNSEKILITHIQKVFNGKSIFGIGGKSIKVNTIILDDSHACIDSINESFKIQLDRKHQIYKDFINLFEDDLKGQGEGSFFEIKNGEFNTFLPVPYWSWTDKKSEIIEILGKYSDEKEVMFTWPLIKNNIENCQCFVGGQGLEISTYLSPVFQFGTFSKANHRILMSATTQNDSFFIKGLGLNIEAVKTPLVCKNEKWSGEKMILIPSLIHEELDRAYIINEFAKPKPSRKVGVVVITSSSKKANEYKHLEATITDTKNIFEEVKKLKDGDYSHTVVIVNRYDGIDLPDDSCRILIIDSMPYFNSLTEKYEEQCRANSHLINIRNAQKIEQGIGRSVRAEKDYSVILFIGNDLIKFVKSSKSSNFLSEQTRKQINIGIEIADIAKEEDLKEENNFSKVIHEVILQCLRRDEGWKEFYQKKMNENVQEISVANNAIEILELERKAEDYFFKNDPENAANYIQEIIDDYFTNDETEKGWYLQTLARYQYQISKANSNKTQKSAFNNNQELLKPKEGINYKKLNYINENRVKGIKNWINDFNDYEELIINIEAIFESLSFGQPSEKFEKALQNLGNALGFLSQRPDKEFKKGPDNLWCVGTNEFFIFECKSEVDDSRTEISKNETGQMNNHCAWFEQEYSTAKVQRILIIPTKNVSNQGNFTHDVKIMRKGKLKVLKDNIKAFFKEFKDYEIKEISDSKIQEWLNLHQLDIKSLKQEYTEEYYLKK